MKTKAGSVCMRRCTAPPPARLPADRTVVLTGIIESMIEQVNAKQAPRVIPLEEIFDLGGVRRMQPTIGLEELRARPGGMPAVGLVDLFAAKVGACGAAGAGRRAGSCSEVGGGAGQAEAG